MTDPRYQAHEIAAVERDQETADRIVLATLVAMLLILLVVVAVYR